MKRLFFFLSGLVILSGCAAMVKPTIQDSFTIDKSFDVVWKATVATFAEKSIPIKVIEKDSGIITTEQIIFAKGFNTEREVIGVAEKPSIFLGTWNQGKYYLSVFVVNNDNKTTKITITAHIEAFENNVSKSWHECYSKGIFEKNIYDSIMAKLK